MTGRLTARFRKGPRTLHKTLIVALALTAAISVQGADIRTMVHCGHPVKDFAVSYDERYVLTRSEGEVCVWDLNNRLLVAALPLYTTEIFPHPTDPRLFYADVRRFKLKAVEDPTLDANRVIDWKTGKSLGLVKAASMPKYAAGSDFTFVRHGDALRLYATADGTGMPAATLGGSNLSAGSARSNGDGSLLLTSGSRPQLWDLRRATLIGEVEHKGRVNEAYFLPGSDRVVLAGPDTVGGNIRQLLFSDGLTIAVGPEHVCKSAADGTYSRMPAFREAARGRMFTAASRTYGGGKFLLGTDNTAVERLGDKGAALMEGSVSGGAPLRLGPADLGKIRDIKISPDDRWAVVASVPGDVAVLELGTMRYVRNLTADYDDLEFVKCCEILPDGTVVAGTTAGKIIVWEKGRAAKGRPLRQHHAQINSITLSADSLRMFTSDNAGQVTVWDVATLQPVVYIHQTDGEDGSGYIFLTPDHYYKATPDVGRLINFVRDGEAYAFEQFDLRNNRPDIVLSRLGGDPAEIELLNRAWKKRLRRAGISEESLSDGYHVPTVAVNRKNVPFITDRGSIILEAEFADTECDLSEAFVTVNGVPVLPAGERAISGRSHRMTREIALARGNNEITVWCANSRGAGSLRETLSVTYAPVQEVKPDLYIVAAGVSEYADSRYNLGFAAKDAADFVSTVSQGAAGRFGQVRTLTLTDKEVTASALAKIRKFLSASRPDDVTLLFFAGHGVLDANLDYFLGASDMDFSNPQRGGIAYDDFMGVFDGVPALNRACFIDACHSGELDKEDYLAVNTVAMPEGEELLFRSAGQNVTALQDVERVNTVLADMFRDTRWGVGATVLSSAGAGELAVESPQWNNGLFTYCLLKGIKGDAADTDGDGKTSLLEWIDYTRRQVTDMSQGRQSPTLRAQNYHNILEIK